jgi:ABC-2 type transport system permease protein
VNLWRLEWLRVLRTKRWIALFGVYLFFGFLGPITARYLNEILARAAAEQQGFEFTAPPPTPHDAIAQYVSNAAQLGILVVVVVAAGAFFMSPEIATFLRTRTAGTVSLLTPKYVVAVGASVVAFLVGTGAAWYETVVLIGSPSTSGMLAGIGYGILSLLFVVAVVAAISARAKSTLATVLLSIVALLLMPLLGLIKGVSEWLPSSLITALGSLVGTADAGGFVKAAIVTAVVTLVLLVLAVRGHATREV